MAFIGAAINTVKGIADLYLNNKKLNELREIDTAELQELVPWDKRDDVTLKLLQAEHIHMLSEGASRSELSRIERDIADQMENSLEKKRQELASKKATQLDIAHTVLNIHKLATETADEIERIQKKVDSSEQKSERAQLLVKKTAEELKSDIESAKQSTKKAELKSKQQVNELRSEIQSCSSQIRDLTDAIAKNSRLNRIYFSFCFLMIALLLYLVLS